MSRSGPAALLLLSAPLLAQSFSSRGSFEFRGLLYPQTQVGDSGQAVGEAVLRWDAVYRPSAQWQINAGLEARTDTHRQFAREPRLDVLDQDTARPALSLRRFSATYHRGPVTVELGRQFVRWGKADLLNPTDRFAPRDFTNILQPDYLGVTAARATVEEGSNTLDVVYAPLFTPSRMPLLDQRWVPVAGLADGGARLPGRGQAGVRWNHVASGYEYSFCYYDGFFHQPLFNAALQPGRVSLERFYPRLRLYGGDAAAPLRWFTLKGEAAWFQSPSPLADQFLQYVIQAERLQGEWVFVGGYAGEWVTEKRNPLGFSPDRGIARTFLGRTSYNLDANRTVAFEGAVRQNGAGGYAKTEYTQALGAHWRATAAFVFLRGQPTDFFGAYRRNSFALLVLRYSF